MQTNFRQGIIRKPANVFQATPSGINLVISNNRPLELTLAYKDVNYYHVESADVVNAWTVTSSPTAVWLFIDIDTITGERSFGTSNTDIIVSSAEPSSPTSGQHWFDLNTTTMKQFFSTGNQWVEVIRVFVAKYQNGLITNYQPDGVSHVGITGPSRAGRILYDSTGTAIRTSTGAFLTTETDFHTYGGISNTVRLESDVTLVRAGETIPAYSVVAIKSYGNGMYPTVELADYTDTEDTIIAFSPKALEVGEITSIVTRGLITNTDWDWNGNSVPAGSKLWIGTGLEKGILVPVDPALLNSLLPAKSAVAKVLSTNSVLFQQTFESVGKQGPQGLPGPGSAPATTTTIGTVVLSTPPTNANAPVVVTDTDPRLADSRPPTAHTHNASEVTTSPFGPYGVSNVQTVLTNINNAKLNTTGGTLTGPLVLPGDPTTNLQAAPKQYVDGRVDTRAVLKAGSTMTGDLILNGLPVVDLQAVPKIYVDNLINNVSTPVMGAVFITDAVPQTSGFVGNKVSVGGTLTSFDTTTLTLTVSVSAISGPSSLVPVVDVNGTTVTNFVLVNGIWQGTANITITGSGTITATHADGATFATTATVTTGPQIVNATFAGAGLVYSSTGATSSLRAGVTVNLSVVVDRQVSQIEVIADTGTNNAATPQVFTVTPVAGVGIPATYTYVIPVTIADNGTVATNRSVTVRANVNSIWGSSYNTTANRNTTTFPTPVNEVHFVSCDNLHPSVIFGGIVYPNSQLALKDSESATINVSVLNASSASYTSPNGELSITNPTTIEATKTVTRISGNYNVSINNLQVTAIRSANNAQTVGLTIIQIAHTDPSVSISLPAARLRSGGNTGTSPQIHTISIVSTQRLITPPTLVAPIGSWQGVGFVDSGSGTTWTRDLRVHDNDTKGTHTFTTLVATNLAGKVVTVVTGSSDYVIGGFVTRKCYFSPFQNESLIGTFVTDTTKLSAVDFDGINMTYQNSFADGVRTYAVTDGTVLDQQGNTLHWTDSVAANNNTTGLAFIEIEETV